MPIPFGLFEILLIVVIVLLIFGPWRLPRLAKALGEAIREFRSPSAEQPQTSPAMQESDAARLLIETAAKLGIETGGKSLKQIATEIAEKQKQ